jgi:hypothetical protein
MDRPRSGMCWLSKKVEKKRSSPVGYSSCWNVYCFRQVLPLNGGVT